MNPLFLRLYVQVDGTMNYIVAIGVIILVVAAVYWEVADRDRRHWDRRYYS